MSEQSSDKKPSLASRIRLLAGIGLLTAFFYVFLGSATKGEGVVYFKTVDEALAMPAEQLKNRNIKVMGSVVVGSHRNPEGTRLHDFRVEFEGKVIDVHFEGPMPDTFQEGRQVVVTGKLNHEGKMSADEVSTKCASKYEDGQMPETLKKRFEAPRGS